MLLAVTPLPSPLTTPPVTRTYFISFTCLYLKQSKGIFWLHLKRRPSFQRTVEKEKRAKQSNTRSASSIWRRRKKYQKKKNGNKKYLKVNWGVRREWKEKLVWIGSYLQLVLYQVKEEEREGEAMRFGKGAFTGIYKHTTCMMPPLPPPSTSPHCIFFLPFF